MFLLVLEFEDILTQNQLINYIDERNTSTMKKIKNSGRDSTLENYPILILYKYNTTLTQN